MARIELKHPDGRVMKCEEEHRKRREAEGFVFVKVIGAEDAAAEAPDKAATPPKADPPADPKKDTPPAEETKT